MKKKSFVKDMVGLGVGAAMTGATVNIIKDQKFGAMGDAMTTTVIGGNILYTTKKLKLGGK